ncbi:MAG: NAD(P)/FAD-dependent oxidoreductase [Firmicutes bacterium]|jgi:phytoene dehydrogenase-like protein|nr:NAD(P)/FAD-dependent oxidoreductase [Bacillota bacterium]
MVTSIAIIGAGIAGLSAGCYAQANGYTTRIFEAHVTPGGLCTSWNRKGYVFDGCMHDLAGAGPGSAYYPVWEALGIMPGTSMIFHDEFTRVIAPDGKKLVVYTDPDRLEQHLKDLAPADARLIEEFTRTVRALRGFDLLGATLGGIGGFIRVFPRFRVLTKWMRVPLRDFGLRFSDPFLRKAFPMVQYDIQEAPVGLNMAFLAALSSHLIGWPTGGSRAFARSIEKRYLELGGEIHYRSRVEKILTKDNSAVGVRLIDGTEYPADIVISAADGRTTIFDLLEGKYVNDRLRKYYSKPLERQQFGISVYLGVARDLSDYPRSMVYLLDQPIMVEGKPCDHVSVECFGFDPTMAPPGKGVLKAVFDGSYSYWKNLRNQGEAYEQEKRRLADNVIRSLERHFPGVSEQIEAVDVTTPLTIERFTSNWHGLQAWSAGTGFLDMFRGVAETLPGLSNFYMVGHWAMGSIGISTVAGGARNVIRKICRKDGRPFVEPGRTR